LGTPAAASAAGTLKWGYALVNVTPASSTVASNYQRQSNGQHPTVVRNGTGENTVTFPGIAAAANDGIVQITAAQSPGFCQSNGWHISGTNVVASVLCFSASGASADLPFTIEYTVASGSRALAYGWDDVVTGSGALPSLWSYDGKGGALSSTNTSTGNYTVTVPNLAGGNGTVKITPWGFSPTRCSVVSWGGGSVRVGCTDAAGNPKNSAFNLTFVNRLPLIGVVGHKNGYSWNYFSSSDYNPSGPYQFDSAAGTMTINYLGTGMYVVRFAGFGQNHGNVQATAYGSAAGVTCNADGWDGEFSLENVYVTCTNGSGTNVDSLFTVQFFI
jgi:hypothetical protein